METRLRMGWGFLWLSARVSATRILPSARAGMLTRTTKANNASKCSWNGLRTHALGRRQIGVSLIAAIRAATWGGSPPPERWASDLLGRFCRVRLNRKRYELHAKRGSHFCFAPL